MDQSQARPAPAARPTARTLPRESSVSCVLPSRASSCGRLRPILPRFSGRRRWGRGREHEPSPPCGAVGEKTRRGLPLSPRGPSVFTHLGLSAYPFEVTRLSPPLVVGAGVGVVPRDLGGAFCTNPPATLALPHRGRGTRVLHDLETVKEMRESASPPAGEERNRATKLSPDSPASAGESPCSRPSRPRRATFCPMGRDNLKTCQASVRAGRLSVSAPRWPSRGAQEARRDIRHRNQRPADEEADEARGRCRHQPLGEAPDRGDERPQPRGRVMGPMGRSRQAVAFEPVQQDAAADPDHRGGADDGEEFSAAPACP